MGNRSILLVIFYHYYYYYYYVLRKLMGKPWGFSAQDAILCQNGYMAHEKQWNDFQIYLKPRVTVYHNLTYTIPLVRHGQELVHSTCLTWDFLNTYHMFFHEATRVCIAQATNLGNQYASPATWIWTLNDVTVAFGFLSLHTV